VINTIDFSKVEITVIVVDLWNSKSSSSSSSSSSIYPSMRPD